MFAYCTNDPVNNEDPDGDIAWWVGAAVGGAISGVLFGGAGKIASKGIRALRSARAARKVVKVRKVYRPKVKMNLQLCGAKYSKSATSNAVRLTAKEATHKAEKLGYKKTNYRSSGQPVFKKGNKYITPDVDQHNGGVWKMADSIKNLGSRKTRMGTYDKNLRRIGD